MSDWKCGRCGVNHGSQDGPIVGRCGLCGDLTGGRCVFGYELCDTCIDDAEAAWTDDRRTTLRSMLASGYDPGAADDHAPGWGIFNDGEIQRYDEAGRFADDQDALAHVRRLLRRHPRGWVRLYSRKALGGTL